MIIYSGKAAYVIFFTYVDLYRSDFYLNFVLAERRNMISHRKQNYMFQWRGHKKAFSLRLLPILKVKSSGLVRGYFVYLYNSVELPNIPEVLVLSPIISFWSSSHLIV